MGINFFLRKLLHLLTGIFIYFLSFHLSQTKLILFLIFFWFLFSLFEILRLSLIIKIPFENLWKKLLKEDEKSNLTDSWFYLTGVTLAGFFLKIDSFRLLILILAFSDPLASLVGFYIGKTRVYKNKTLEGALTFFLISFIISYFFLKCSWHTFFLSLFLTLVEVLTRRDNFWIPVGGTFYLNLTKYFLGLF
ncbi:MAG: hypothetical protein NZ530_05205 [Thermodesulfobacteriaceae bacterium]|nr:hypothetical protein [Thermodesulfobacteriaceae bacterium]MCX8040943.1 hypothetical protein [Thermodesulfobacteriaceae bacterium]MDW8135701.1 hypothetical protein [Thermodesulfobacterium sp.]